MGLQFRHKAKLQLMEFGTPIFCAVVLLPKSTKLLITSKYMQVYLQILSALQILLIEYGSSKVQTANAPH
jgi:hypothetical protein